MSADTQEDLEEDEEQEDATSDDQELQSLHQQNEALEIQRRRLIQENAKLERVMTQRESLMQQRLANAALMHEIEQIEAWIREMAAANASSYEQQTSSQVNPSQPTLPHLAREG